MHSEFRGKHLLLKGAVHAASSCNLLLQHTLLLHFLYTQKSMFKIQLHYSSSDFSYPIYLLYARKGIWCRASL